MVRYILICLVFILISWDVTWWTLGVEPLLPWQLRRTLADGQTDYYLLDARLPFEYRWFHIKGAENYPDVLLNPEVFHPPETDRPVVVICMTGHRSAVVAHRLKGRGFPHVYNLIWGMVGWLLSGGPTVRGLDR